MARDDYDTRKELLDLLLSKVSADPYPSVTMMDMIEGLMTPQEVPSYAKVLLEKIQRDDFPSISLLKRVRALS